VRTPLEFEVLTCKLVLLVQFARELLELPNE